jgi:hypothetical protein
MTASNNAVTAKKIINILCQPISSMSGLVLFMVAGSRLSYAMIAACALLWVFLLSSFTNILVRGIDSDMGRMMLNVMISSFASGLYYLFLYLLNPLLAMETVLICALAPVFFMGCGFRETLGKPSAGELFRKAVREPLSLGVVTIAFSLIREPLGFATLSIPGGVRGIIELFNSDGHYIYTVQLISSSTGALFLLAYIMIALRYMDAGRFLRR